MVIIIIDIHCCFIFDKSYIQLNLQFHQWLYNKYEFFHYIFAVQNTHAQIVKFPHFKTNIYIQGQIKSLTGGTYSSLKLRQTLKYPDSTELLTGPPETDTHWCETQDKFEGYIYDFHYEYQFKMDRIDQWPMIQISIIRKIGKDKEEVVGKGEYFAPYGDGTFKTQIPWKNTKGVAMGEIFIENSVYKEDFEQVQAAEEKRIEEELTKLNSKQEGDGKEDEKEGEKKEEKKDEDGEKSKKSE